tara:strand:- start:5442 stop:5903 length:462 start_codon:yes stop_codon:yes gene_type:complete
MTPCLGQAEPSLDRHHYLLDVIAQYGAAVERCDSRREEAVAPPSDALDILRQHPEKQIRFYLLAREYQLLDQCTESELLSLLLAIGSLNVANDLSAETQQAVQAMEETLFDGTRLEMEMHYRQLPNQMKAELNSISYFQKPYDTFVVMDALGW